MTDDKKKFQSEWEKLLAPSPTRPKSTAPISGVLSEPEMEDILRQAGWPESEVPYMAKMGTKESSGKVSADRVRRAGQGQRLPESSYGLWQINTLAHPQYDPDRLASDPVYNAKAALEVFQKQGYNAWFNSRRKLAAEGILPGNVQSAAPQATVEDLFPNVNGFATATATVPAVESVEDLFPNVDGFKDTNVGSTPTNPTGAYVPLDPKASAIPQSPLDVGIPAYTPPAQTTQVENPSRPNERPVLKRKDERALAPVKPRATVAVGSEPEIGRAEEDYGTIVDQGVYVQDHRTLGRKGDKTGNVVKTVTVDYTPERRDRQYTARRAAEQVAADYDLSADQVAQLSDRLASAPLLSEGSSADQYYITKDDIAAVKGDLNLPTVEARPFVEIPPESLFTPELAEKGLLDVPLVGAAGDVQNTAAGVVASGGRVWQALAGLYRIADDLNKRPFGDGTNRFINPQKEEDIKVYQGDDIYKYMMSVANDAQAPANSLAKFGGTRAEFFQMAGGLPGDFSRIMIMSATPGGIVTGMSADMAMQAAGRGESYDQVAKEGLKGALFGSIARFATPVGQGIAQNTGSRVAGGAGSLAFTGAATYPVSRVFGADVKTALKETLFNTIFAMADAAPVLLGKKIRVKDTEGSQVVVEIKQDGTAQEIELSKDQPADIEVLDSEAAEGTRKYEDQRLEAARIVYEQRQRPIVERMAEAEFTVGDKGDSLAANPAAISVLNDLLIENQKSLPEDFEGFHGLAMTDGTAIGAFTKWAENRLDEAQAAGNAGDMVTISNFITKLKEAGTQTQGRAALFADYKDLPEYTQGTRSEELTHLKNDLAGVQRVADFIAELPGAKTLLGFLDKVYDTSTKPVRVDEAIAQSFRADAPEHLGRSKQEIRRAQQELFRTLKETEDFDVNAYAESLEGISRRGDVFARYARQVRRAELSRERGLADVTGRETAVDPDVRGVLEPRRPGTGESSRPAGSGTGGPAGRGDLPNAAENSFESGDLVTIRGGEMLPYQIQKITGDQVDLIEAGSVDPDSVITLPLSEIELLDDGGRSKLGPVLRTEEVDLFENINDAEAVVDNSSLYKSSFEDQVAGTRPATQSNINPERVSYLNSILQGKDPKITTAKVGGQDVTFLGNNKSKVMLQPDEVPFVEQALRDPLFAQLWGRSDIAPAKTFQEHLSKIEGQDRDTLFGRFRRRKLETDSPTPTPTPTSLFEESGPPKEWLAKHKEIQDTAVSKAKDVLNSLSPRVRFAVNGNWMYGVDLSHGMWVNKPWEFREGFRNALDKLSGADKTELLESGVEEKLTTLFETAYKEVEAAKQTEESRNSWLAADYSLSEGRSPGYDPSGTEQWLGDIDVTRIMFAKVFKDNRIFDTKTKQEVLDFGAEEFPHLFSLLGRKSTGKPLVTNPNVAAGERIQAARGMEAEGSVSKYAGMLVQLYQSFKRQFKEIDPNESIQMARTADSFRLMSNLNNWAKVQATNDVARITEGLTREQYDVFENVLILRDKQQAVEKGMKPGHGYVDLTDVETSLKEYERAAAADPAIAKALGEREALRRDTVQGLVDIGMLGEEALDNTRYFHRQVPQEASGNMFLSLGNRDLRVRKKGFEKKRTGEGDDYNTNYVESEIEWVSQAHAQIRKQGLLSEIDRAVNIANDLKTEAKITGADWRSLVPADHRIWQPKEGSYFYEAMAVPDQMLMKSLTSGLIPAMKQSDLQAVLAKGQRKPEWVLPKGVAKLMDEFSTRIDDLPHANLYSNAQASWKQWMLINPKNYLSYNLRNFISDLDAAMSYPGMITELPAAIKDIWGYSRSRNHPAAAEIELAIKDGVMDSGQTFAEIPDIGKLGVFKMFADTDQNILSRGMSKVWETMKGTTNARENWIRLAAYRHIKKKLEAGEIIYGASTPGQVQALTPGRQAAKLARELVGDYGGISEAGRAIRKHMIPFYSWLEINAPRYVRLLKNMPAEAKANSRSTGPRLAGRVLYDGTKMGAKLAALTAGINIWNHVMFPDLEEDLKKTDIGKRPHLIVGRNPDGSARIFQADTALRDAMDWLDLGDAVSDVYQLQTGQATVTDKLAEAAKAPVNRVVQGLGPFKAAGELVTGRSTFPTIFEKGTSFNLQTRPIRDRAEHLAQTFAVKGIYQRVMGRPVPPSSGPVGQASDWFLTTRVDPRESIFWHMKGKVQDYKKKIGKASPGSDPTDKGNTLFYYKQALRWNNEEAAARYLKQYKEEFGGTNAGLRASLKKTHPLGSLAKRDWDDFEKTLTPEEKEMLQIAVDYFEGNINK